ncbi:MAG: GNAT family N-acetyltransferase [Kiloniellales bacterium]
MNEKSKGQPRVRRAQARDVPAIIACVRAAYQVYVERMGKEPAPMLADYAALTAADRVRVLELDGRLAGAIVLFARGDHLFVETIAVDPAFQGRGLGRHLMDFAEAVARDRGLPAIRLYTNVHMTENLSFYDRLGYAVTGRVHEDGYDRVYFEKTVS